MDQTKAFNEVLTIYYELLEVVGTAPSLWNVSNDTIIKQFPTDIEFTIDVGLIISKHLTANEIWLINEYFFNQDFLDGAQKIQFAGIQSRIGKIFVDLEIYPVIYYDKRNT